LDLVAVSLSPTIVKELAFRSAPRPTDHDYLCYRTDRVAFPLQLVTTFGVETFGKVEYSRID